MKILLILSCCLSVVSVLAQRGVNYYSRENGMISNEINDVTYDKDGFLWIATDNGIDRFDGQRFVHFQNDPSDPNTICGNTVLRIAYDHKGFIWAATMNSGLIRISTTTLRVKNYRYEPKKTGTISDNRSTAIFVDPQGDTWICPHYRGLDYYDVKKDRFINYRPSEQIAGLDPRRADLFSDVIADRHDPELFWCVSLDGLFSFNKRTRTWKHFPVKENTFIEPTRLTGYEKRLSAVEQDGKGNLYIGTLGGGLLYFDKNQGIYRRFLFEGMLPVSNVRNMISDLKWRDSRYLYICASYFDFLLFDTKTKEFIRYADAERTITQPVRMARNGTQIAIGGKTGLYIQNEALVYGKRYHYPFDIRKIAFHPLKNEWLACNSDKKGEVYFKSTDGKGKTYRFFENQPPFDFSALFVLYTGKNGYWVIGRDRIARFSPEKGLKEAIRFPMRPSSDPISMIPNVVFNDGDSVLWIGTKYDGVLHYSITRNALQQFRHDPKNPAAGPQHNAWFFSFVKNGDHLYYGYEEGVGAIDLKTKRFFKPAFSKILPRVVVRCMALDPKGLLWIGTIANGIWVVDIRKNKVVRKINTMVGLKSQRIDKLLFDDHNSVWAMAPQCVTVINRATYQTHTLENQHGMMGIYDIILDKGNLYFLQENGFVMSASGSSLPQVNDPIPYIQGLRELNLSGGAFIHQRHRFDYDENNLAFEFGVLDYSNTANNFVSYRLKGLEENWRSGKGTDEATYYNLPGGSYVFQVRSSENGHERIVEYPFEIIPPFWLQWWFIVLSVLLLAASAIWFMRTRISRVQKEERMRAEFNRQINEMEAKALRAQMNPHFLFNSLNSIRLFILKNEVESASDYIAKFSKLLRMILNHSRQDSITVYDEIQTLKLYLEFERLRFDHGFEFDIQIDGQEVLGCYLPPMIIQPFVENAIWHGLMPRKDDKGYIRISFEMLPGLLYVTVHDNGIGREKAKINNRKASLKEGSVGLKITKDRLRTLTRRTKRLNDYVIEDLVDGQGRATGTLIKLYFETEEKQ